MVFTEMIGHLLYYCLSLLPPPALSYSPRDSVTPPKIYVIMNIIEVYYCQAMTQGSPPAHSRQHAVVKKSNSFLLPS